MICGEFPRVTPLNPAFIPGLPLLKLGLKIGPDPPCGGATAYIEALSGFLPSLSFHRCCGNNSVKESFFQRHLRRERAMEEHDDAVDLAHLVEHVMIDIQHFIARMRVCSGVTCARNSPRDRFDVFVECQEEIVARAAAGIALDLVEDLLDGLRPDPRYLCLIQLAQLAHDHPGQPVNPRLRALETTWGRRLVREAVVGLRRRGFLSEIPVAFNFSGGALIGFHPRKSAPPVIVLT